MTANTNPFEDLIVTLRKHGFGDAAGHLEELLGCAWTSSSEFVGELGLAVLRFQQEHPTMPTELRSVLKRCMKEVRAVWPGIR